MSRRSRRRNSGDHSYWKSITDAMAGLLLSMLLILMLFMVRIISLDDLGKFDDEYLSDDKIEYHEESDNSAGGSTSKADSDENDGGGGGSGKNDFTGYEETEPEEGDKCAVQVRVMDEDAQKYITEEGITFDLLDSSNKVKTLHTYYPTTENYDSFQTEPTGTFFLPEKLEKGTYTLREVTNAKGYGLSGPVSFTVDRAQDWDDPMIVTVQLGPEKNRIYIHVTDEAGKDAAVKASYEVYAATDITTGDTLRYKKDQLVDTIQCDKLGMGQTKDLYLGKYRIVQKIEEDGYASVEDEEVTLQSKTDPEPIREIVCSKTKIAVQLTDELDSGIPVEGAVFQITDNKGSGPVKITTDKDGYAEAVNLKKNTKYTLKQISTVDNYKIDETIHTFEVDKNGRINDDSKVVCIASNRMTRMTLKVSDRFLRSNVDGVKVELYDSKNKMIHSFDSEIGVESINGLEPGQYRAVLDGTDEYSIELKDDVNIQNFTFSVVTSADYIALGGAAVILLGSCLTATALIIKRRKRK